MSLSHVRTVPILRSFDEDMQTGLTEALRERGGDFRLGCMLKRLDKIGSRKPDVYYLLALTEVMDNRDEQSRAHEFRARGIEVVTLANALGKVDLAAMLAELGRRGVNEVHLESGTCLNGSMLREGCIDELLLYLAPKLFGRVIRFQRAADLLSRRRDLALADAALSAGFADQAHLSREFVALAGVSPAAYRALGLIEPNHVPVGDGEASRRVR